MTPLIRADRLADELGFTAPVWVKDDSANPTHSFKDRVVSVAITAARELGFDRIACASTGNLANSVSAHAARIGMPSIVFIPADLEPAKIIQTADLRRHLGRYRRLLRRRQPTVSRAIRDWTSSSRPAFVNVNVRPYYAEGSKTLGFEVAEQLGWRLPAQVVAPMASGSLLTKVHKAFTRAVVGRPRVTVVVARVRGAIGGVLADRDGVRERLGCGTAGEADRYREVAQYR